MAAAKNTPSDSEGTAVTNETAVTDETEAATTAATESADDDLRRKYLEALERKRAGGSAAATGHGADKATAPTSNNKVQRTFRRRAGG
jgi:hypothetical protein